MALSVEASYEIGAGSWESFGEEKQIAVINEAPTMRDIGNNVESSCILNFKSQRVDKFRQTYIHLYFESFECLMLFLAINT